MEILKSFYSSCSNELVPPLVPVNTTHDHGYPPPPVTSGEEVFHLL